MKIREAIKQLRESDVLELTNGNTPDRQAVNVALRSLEEWEKVKQELIEEDPIVWDVHNDYERGISVGYGDAMAIVLEHLQEITHDNQ